MTGCPFPQSKLRNIYFNYCTFKLSEYTHKWNSSFAAKENVHHSLSWREKPCTICQDTGRGGQGSSGGNEGHIGRRDHKPGPIGGYSKGFFFLINVFILFIYFWLHCVFIATCGLSLVGASGGYSSLRCVGLSLRWLLLLWSTGSRHVGSVVAARGLSSCGSQALERRLSSCGTRA